MADLILAIDQGTTGTTALALDPAGRIRGRAYREIRQYYPRPGWVEHDPEEIARSVTSTAKRAMAAARAGAGDVNAIGITNQ
ncbi:MAG: FGGY family carbohydrate kinase, partial [Candidatus Binataceae bacterium]